MPPRSDKFEGLDEEASGWPYANRTSVCVTTPPSCDSQITTAVDVIVAHLVYPGTSEALCAWDKMLLPPRDRHVLRRLGRAVAYPTSVIPQVRFAEEAILPLHNLAYSPPLCTLASAGAFEEKPEM